MTNLDVLTLKVWNLLGEAASIVNRARRLLVGADDAVRKRNAVIVFSERRRLVDDTSSAVACHVCVIKDSEGTVLILPILVRLILN